MDAQNIPSSKHFDAYLKSLVIAVVELKMKSYLGILSGSKEYMSDLWIWTHHAIF